MTVNEDNLIVDRYKGLEIRILAHIGDYNTWHCSIQVQTVPQCTRKKVQKTVRATTSGITRSAVMALAFIEALGICDFLLESSLLSNDLC